MSKPIKKLASVALPVAGGAFGPLGAAAGGALGGALSGGGLKGALIGGATGGLGSAVGSGALGGLTGATAKAAQGAILGAGAGAGDGLKGALLGAGLGGLGGAILGGGTPLGTRAGAPLSGGLQGPTQGSGVLGSVTRAAGSGGGLSSLTGSGGSGVFSLGNVLRTGATALSGAQSEDAFRQMQRQLLAAQGRAQDVIQPFADTGLQAQQQLSQRLTEGFQPGDLTQDPGYQFRLQQGQQALERSLAAQGLGQSGAALKAAQQYGQGLADQTYQDAFGRYLAQNQQIGGLASQGQQAAGSLAGLFQGTGAANAASTAAIQDQRNRTLASILGGSGFAGVY